MWGVFRVLSAFDEMLSGCHWLSTVRECLVVSWENGHVCSSQWERSVFFTPGLQLLDSSSFEADRNAANKRQVSGMYFRECGVVWRFYANIDEIAYQSQT